MTSTQPAGAGQPDPRRSGARIEALLDATAASGPTARARAEALLREVVDLYGAGLERVLEIVEEAEAFDDALAERLAADELVSGLLLVHGLHPYPVEDRIERALAGLRPYLGSHGGNVELVGVTEDGVVRLRMLGSCEGCPSSAVTLQLAVEGAVSAAAPETVGIEVEEAAPSPGVIPVSALSARIHADASWEPLDGVDALAAGELRPASVGHLELVVCRVAGTLYAYRDRCPACGAGLAEGSLERAPGGAALTCPGCRARFDVTRAGAALDGSPGRLVPVPLLEHAGAVSVAVAGAGLRSPVMA